MQLNKVKTKNNLPTVVIGIPAHNEENNIGYLLDSIIKQKRDNYVLDQVVVICDGCTDSTADIVNKYLNKFTYITLVNDGKRLGKSKRINDLYRSYKCNIFINFDADITIKSKLVISELVKGFKDPKIVLVGGSDVPLTPKTFVEKIVVTYESFWAVCIQNVNRGDNVHNNPGCIYAIRGDFAKEVNIPLNIIAEDHFVYFKALEHGYKFKFAKKAKVIFKVPANFKDYMLQSTRFLKSTDNIEKYFGGWVNDYYKIPRLVKFKAYLKVFLKEPIFLPLAMLLQVVQRAMSYRFVKNNVSSRWISVRSSK